MSTRTAPKPNANTGTASIIVEYAGVARTETVAHSLSWARAMGLASAPTVRATIKPGERLVVTDTDRSTVIRDRIR